MATLPDHTLLYDRDCPMCRIYTGAFVKGSWLDDRGRHPYSEVAAGDYCGLDLARAKDEIALVNRSTGEVTYGLEGLLKVIAHRWPALKRPLRFPPLRGALQQLYLFISYNRKVIAAVKPTGKACNPSYHAGYRLAYLAFAFLLVSGILASYAGTMSTLLPAGHAGREYAVCGGQIIFQGVVVYTMRRRKLMDYLGNMMTVSLMGALALLPALILRHWLKGQPSLFAGYFLTVAGGMLLEHLRRVKLLDLGLLPSITWVLYRLIVLAVVLI